MNEHDHILILGCGASGLAMARWCARAGARVVVADTREDPPQLAALREAVPQAEFVAGAFDAALLDRAGGDAGASDPGLRRGDIEVARGDISLVLRSPGLTPEQVAPVIDAAKQRGVRVMGELGLFAEALAELKARDAYAPQILAVTGTNGKTTVTSLTGQLVERAGKTVAIAGNIGPTLMETLAAKLGSGALPQVWVLELSSFQLDGVEQFEPTAATVLNISQDHLDWHGTMEAYAAAKARIFGEHGTMVLNREDAVVMRMLPEAVKAKGGKLTQREYVTFGGGLPQRPGDFGIEVVNGMAWLVRAHEADETRKRGRGGEAEEEEIHLQRLMPADALRIRGRHNAINALSALALAMAAGCTLAPMLYGLREYRGEPHRVEPVGIVREIEYFDDSKGTNVGATVAALQGLGAERKLVVILGGDGKGQDFAPLAQPVSQFARCAVLIGRDAPQIRAVLEPAGVPLADAGTLEEAVRVATQRAQPGDAVLMSPACASFDMFRNYEHRAQAFVAAVHAIADEAGVMIEGDTA